MKSLEEITQSEYDGGRCKHDIFDKMSEGFIVAISHDGQSILPSEYVADSKRHNYTDHVVEVAGYFKTENGGTTTRLFANGKWYYYCIGRTAFVLHPDQDQRVSRFNAVL